MKKTALTLLISTLSTTVMAQNVVVFGDSLSDIGQQNWAYKASYNNNPLYNEILAQKLGETLRSSSQGGSNYAYSAGVAVGSNSTRSTIQPNVVVQQQIQNYLNQGVNPAGLHIVWAGGNDLAAILQRALSGSNPVGEVVAGATEAAQATAQQWITLRNMGVETAVFPTIPNVVYTPSLFQQFGQSAAQTLKNQAEQFVPAAQAQLVADAFSQAFNANLQTLNASTQRSFAEFEQARLAVLQNSVAALYQSSIGTALAAIMDQQTATQTLVQSYQQAAQQASQATALLNDYTTRALNQAGGNVVRLDVDALFKDLLEHPAAYGLTNTVGEACQTTTQTQCTPTNANADQMLFADNFHPNVIAHQVMADYIYTTLNSPKEMVALAYLAERNHEIALESARTESNLNRLSRQAEKTISAFAQQQQYNGGNSTHLGIKAQFTPEWQFSTMASTQKQKVKLGGTQADSKTKSLNATLRYDAARWWAGSALQLSQSNYQIQRNVQLGSVTHSQAAETNGATISASLFGGYEWALAKNIISALADLTYSHSKIAAFGEKNIGATRLEFGEQKTNAVKTGIGAAYRFQGEQLQPFVSVRWIKDWAAKEQKLAVGLNGSQFKVNLPKSDRSWLNLQAGINYQFAKLPLNVTAYLSHDLGRQEKIAETSATFGLGYQF